MEDKLYRITRKNEYLRCQIDAESIIKKALCYNRENIAVAVSGGKDSVVLAHMVSKQCKPFLLFTDSGLEPPESVGIVHELSKKLNLEIITEKRDAIQWLKENGRDKSKGSKIDIDCIDAPTKSLLSKYKIGTEFVGLREEESKKRRFLIRTNGVVFENKKWGCITAYPLRRWTARDVFAYIDEYKLPLHPAYTRTSWQERDKIRVSWIWDVDFENRGAIEYLRKFYPQIYKKLREIKVLEG